MHGAALFILWQVDARVFEGMLLDKLGKPCLINQHVKTFFLFQELTFSQYRALE